MARTDRSLTLRGRALLAAGVTTALCGLLLVERDLVRLGVLVSTAPLVALLYVVRRKPDLEIRRVASPPSVPAGGVVDIAVQVRNLGRGSGVLTLEERLPYALGDRPRFDLAPLPPQVQTTVHYRLHPTLRGRYVLGPARLRVREPFGLAEVAVDLPGTRDLVVVPAVTPLPDIDISGGWFGAGGEHARSYAVGDVADATIRDYRRGDDLRRVHWPSTARLGELMVRREERPMQASATLVIDNRTLAHRGSGPGSTLEAAVTAAASVGAHLIERGYQVRLLTSAGLHEQPGTEQWQSLLRELAVMPLTTKSSWPSDLEMQPDGLVIGFFAAAGAEHQAWAATLASASAMALAVLVDAGADSGRWLTENGWTGVHWRSGTSLAEAWQDLGR